MNDPDELDRLVDELNAATVDGSRRPPRLEAWLAALRQHQGSDLFLVAGAPPQG
jgi:hypothetical protein